MARWFVWMLISVLLFMILLSTGIYFFEKGSNEIELNFFINETRENLNGEIFVNNVSIGEVKSGIIKIPKEQLTFSSFIFRANYKNNIHSFEYEFLPEYEQYRSINFIVLKNQLESGLYVAGSRSFLIQFYDNKTKCPLNGKIYFNDHLIGDARNGDFVFNEQYYDSFLKENSSMYIFGITDSCFGKNIDLPYAAYWDVYGFEGYFATNKTLTLNPSLNPRQPSFEIEMQAFIRPNDVKFYLSELTKYADKEDIEASLDAIAKYYITYQTDKIQFNEIEYWQTPTETLRNGKGDCEDWAITTLSLMRAYNSSIKCYNALWPEHISVFCYFDNNFIIYDQDKVKSKTSLNLNLDVKTADIINQENRIALREMLNRYFDSYGLKVKDRKLLAVFNEQEVVKFEDNEEFIDWAVELVKN